MSILQPRLRCDCREGSDADRIQSEILNTAYNGLTAAQHIDLMRPPIAWTTQEARAKVPFSLQLGVQRDFRFADCRQRSTSRRVLRLTFACRFHNLHCLEFDKTMRSCGTAAQRELPHMQP